MKKGLIVLFILIEHLYGQSFEFNISVSNDTLLLGNYLEVKFEINNGNGTFIPPDFAGWNVVSGPNTASSYSYINGVVNQSSSYTYYLEAPNEGDFIINEAKLKVGEIELKTPAIKVYVLNNPEGIRQHPSYKSDEKNGKSDLKLQEAPKKKRKATRL